MMMQGGDLDRCSVSGIKIEIEICYGGWEFCVFFKKLKHVKRRHASL